MKWLGRCAENLQTRSLLALNSRSTERRPKEWRLRVIVPAVSKSWRGPAGGTREAETCIRRSSAPWPSGSGVGLSPNVKRLRLSISFTSSRLAELHTATFFPPALTIVLVPVPTLLGSSWSTCLKVGCGSCVTKRGVEIEHRCRSSWHPGRSNQSVVRLLSSPRSDTECPNPR